jgi:hypothetical protein
MENKRKVGIARSTTLSIRLGTWFEAHATGWGVVAAIIALTLLTGLALIRYLSL